MRELAGCFQPSASRTVKPILTAATGITSEMAASPCGYAVYQLVSNLWKNGGMLMTTLRWVCNFLIAFGFHQLQHFHDRVPLQYLGAPSYAMPFACACERTTSNSR